MQAAQFFQTLCHAWPKGLLHLFSHAGSGIRRVKRARRVAASALRGCKVLCLGLCVFLSACGFHLKGATPLPFTTLYTNISLDSEFGAGFRRAILAASPGLRLVDTPDAAQARLVQLSLRQSLRDISIDARGRVEEYELNLEFQFQVTDAQDRFLLEPTTLRAMRELPHDPDAVQARQSEITAVFRNMQQSMIARIIRRLTAPEIAQAYRNAAMRPRDGQGTDLTPLPAADAQPLSPVLQ